MGRWTEQDLHIVRRAAAGAEVRPTPPPRKLGGAAGRKPTGLPAPRLASPRHGEVFTAAAALLDGAPA